MKIKIVSSSNLDSLDKMNLRRFDYVLKETINHIGTSESGFKYTHYQYIFINKNNEEIIKIFNDFFEAESGFEEYWNGKHSGSTVDTKIKLKEKISGKSIDFIFKEERGSSVVEKFLNVVHECHTINEIRLKIELSELKSKIERLENKLENHKETINKIHEITLEYVKLFKPNIFLVEKIKEVSDNSFSRKLNRLETHLKKLNESV